MSLDTFSALDSPGLKTTMPDYPKSAVIMFSFSCRACHESCVMDVGPAASPSHFCKASRSLRGSGRIAVACQGLTTYMRPFWTLPSDCRGKCPSCTSQPGGLNKTSRSGNSQGMVRCSWHSSSLPFDRVDSARGNLAPFSSRLRPWARSKLRVAQRKRDDKACPKLQAQIMPASRCNHGNPQYLVLFWNRCQSTPGIILDPKV